MECYSTATRLPLDKLSTKLLPIQCHLSATQLPLDCHSPLATWLPLDCHLTVIWPPLDCHSTATRLSLNCHLSTNWPQIQYHWSATWVPLEWLRLPIECYSTVTWTPLNFHWTATALSLEYHLTDTYVTGLLSDVNRIRCKIDHQMAPFALFANLATRWSHLHKLQIWPPDGTTWIGSKCCHQVAPFALFAKLATRLCHLHCHIALDCPIGQYWLGILISQSHIS